MAGLDIMSPDLKHLPKRKQIAYSTKVKDSTFFVDVGLLLAN